MSWSMACRVSGRCGKPAHNPMTSSANFFVRFFSSWLISGPFEIRTSAVAIATPEMRATQAFRRHDSRNSISAGTWLGRAGIGNGLLAFELDAVGCAGGLYVFSALAWL